MNETVEDAIEFADAFEEVFDEMRAALTDENLRGLTLATVATEQPCDRMTKASFAISDAMAADEDDARLELLGKAAAHLCVAIRIALNGRDHIDRSSSAGNADDIGQGAA